MPDNREWAILIWVGVVLLLSLMRQETRSSLMGLLRAVASPKIFVPSAVMAAWVCIEIWIACRFVRWNPDLTKGAVVWFISAGIVLMVRFQEASTKPRFFWKAAVGTLAFPVFVEFYLNLYPLCLLEEVFLQPIFAIIAVISVVAARDDSYRSIRAFGEWILIVVALSLLTYVAIRTVQDWGEFDITGLMYQFALPVWLTIGLLPFIFLLALYSGYEIAFVRMSLHEATSPGHRLRSKLAILLGMRLRMKDLSDFRGYWLCKVAEAQSFREAYAAVREYRDGQRRATRQAVEKKRSLKKLTGVRGEDRGGRQLDMREFEETASALLWFWTCMMGWYKRENRYRDDLLDIVDDSLDRYDLPEPTGIELRVSEDGQAWFAWRRTVTGWCFAIGAAGPPPDEWTYDGPVPPDGFPGRDPAWGSDPFSENVRRNW